MSTSIEREYKTMIQPRDYQRIKDDFESRQAKLIIQSNYYFDTPSLNLKSINAALRLRVFNSGAEWTLKVSKNEVESIELTHHLDNSINVPQKLSEDIIQKFEILEFLSKNNIDISQLVSTHSFKTHRLTFSEDCCLWCLDMTDFHYTRDYELECELKQHLTQQEWKEKLEKLSIDFHPAPTKIARASFYAQLFKLNFKIM